MLDRMELPGLGRLDHEAREPRRGRGGRRRRVPRDRDHAGRRRAARLLGLGHLLAHRVERPAQQARDVHLRDADALGDLRLGQVLDEAQVAGSCARARAAAPACGRSPRRTRPSGTPGPRRRSCRPGPRRPRPGPTVASSEYGRRALAASIASRTSSRSSPVCSATSAADGARPELRRQHVDRAVDLRDPLLEAARQVDLAPAVAEVALELAEDGRRRVARERVPERRVEALDRLDQAQARDLVQVLRRLGAAGVAVGEAARERQEALDQLLAHGAGRASGGSARAAAARPPAARPPRGQVPRSSGLSIAAAPGAGFRRCVSASAPGASGSRRLRRRPRRPTGHLLGPSLLPDARARSPPP